MSAGRVIVGVLAGAAAGAILGVLWAPDKGSETRKMIRRKGEEYAGAAKDKFNRFMDNVSDQIDEVKNEVDDLAEKGKRKVQSVKKNVNTTMK